MNVFIPLKGAHFDVYSEIAIRMPIKQATAVSLKLCHRKENQPKLEFVFYVKTDVSPLME